MKTIITVVLLALSFTTQAENVKYKEWEMPLSFDEQIPTARTHQVDIGKGTAFDLMIGFKKNSNCKPVLAIVYDALDDEYSDGTMPLKVEIRVDRETTWVWKEVRLQSSKGRTFMRLGLDHSDPVLDEMKNGALMRVKAHDSVLKFSLSGAKYMIESAHDLCQKYFSDSAYFASN